jgi:hypothetical protein
METGENGSIVVRTGPPDRSQFEVLSPASAGLPFVLVLAA